MKITLLILAFLTGCAPKAIVVEPIAPAVEKAHAAAVATGTASKRVETSVTTIRQKSYELSTEVAAAMLAADRLRKTGLAAQEDLDANADAWHAVQIRNLFLEEAAKSAAIDSHELVEAAEASAEQSGELAITAGIHDRKVQAMQISAARAEADAAFGKSVKWIVWGVLAVALVFAIVKLANTLRP